MSLINDALKRAKQAHAENPTPTPDLPFRPAEPAQNRNSSIPVLPIAVLLIAVVLGGGLILLALQKRDATPQVVHATQPEMATTSTTLPTTTPAITPIAQTAAPTMTTAQAPVASTPTADPSSGPTPDAIDGTKPEPPKTVTPKLQGIFYNPGKPSAVVNGKTVYVGSRVGEARDFVVLQITQESVTVANGSQTNLLVLEQ